MDTVSKPKPYPSAMTPADAGTQGAPPPEPGTKGVQQRRALALALVAQMHTPKLAPKADSYPEANAAVAKANARK